MFICTFIQDEELLEISMALARVRETNTLTYIKETMSL